MNEHLHTETKETATKIKVLQYNIFMKWHEDRIIKMIDEIDADIVALQEVYKHNHLMPINKFLGLYDKYYYELGYRCAKRHSFGQAIMYKPDKFYSIKTIKKWISDTSDVISNTYDSVNISYLLLGTQFMHVENDKLVLSKRPFWVFNTHFGLDETTKTKSCYKIKELIKEIVNGDEFILCGDFNFFQQGDGESQRKIMTEDYQDLGLDAKTLSGIKLNCTFVGMDYDPFKIDLNNLDKANSRLDHVFGSKNVKKIDTCLYSKTLTLTEPKDMSVLLFPSDHLPLVVELELHS